MSEPRGPSPVGILTTLGVLTLAILCCAVPALLAAGVLAGLGGLLRNPWLISGGALVVLASAWAVLARWRRARAGTTSSDCCTLPTRQGAPR